MCTCHFEGKKMSKVLIRSQRVHDSKKGLELLFFPLFYSLKPNRIGLLPQYNNLQILRTTHLSPSSLSFQGKFITPSPNFSTFSYNMICIAFPIFTHIHFMCRLINQYLSGQRVPEDSYLLQRIVELFLTFPLIWPEFTFNFFILFHSGVSY